MRTTQVLCPHGIHILRDCGACDAIPLPEPRKYTRVALIGCSASKLPHAAPAVQLYTGQLFRKSLAYAKQQGCVIRILSAKHGLVHPDTVLQPYNVTLGNMTYQERKSWGSYVSRNLNEFKQDETILLFLCGRSYVDPILGRYAKPKYRSQFYRYERPLEGMGIGQQLHWLTQAGKSA